MLLVLCFQCYVFWGDEKLKKRCFNYDSARIQSFAAVFARKLRKPSSQILFGYTDPVLRFVPCPQCSVCCLPSFDPIATLKLKLLGNKLKNQLVLDRVKLACDLDGVVGLLPGWWEDEQGEAQKKRGPAEAEQMEGHQVKWTIVHHKMTKIR